jgi:hypothetical protein
MINCLQGRRKHQNIEGAPLPGALLKVKRAPKNFRIPTYNERF